MNVEDILAQLRAERARIDAAIKALEGAIPPKVGRPAALQDAVLGAIDSIGRPATTRQIWSALVDSGRSNSYATVRTTVATLNRAKKVKRTLQGWSRL